MVGTQADERCIKYKASPFDTVLLTEKEVFHLFKTFFLNR